jgi:hypothetical protein
VWLRSLIGAAAVAGFLGFMGLLVIANSDEEPLPGAAYAVIPAALCGAGALLGGLVGPLFLGRVKTRGMTAETAGAVYSFEVKDPEAWLRDIEQGEGAAPSGR